jgi:hypothetical protein
MVGCSIAKMTAKKKHQTVNSNEPPKVVGTEEPQLIEDPFGEKLKFLKKITPEAGNPTPIQLIENIKAELLGKTDEQIVAFLRNFPSAEHCPSLPPKLSTSLRIVNMVAEGLIFMPKEENSPRQVLKPVFFESDPNCKGKLVEIYNPSQKFLLRGSGFVANNETVARNYIASQLAEHLSSMYQVPNGILNVRDAYVGNARAMAMPPSEERELSLLNLMKIRIREAPDDVQNHFKCADTFSCLESGGFLYFRKEVYIGIGCDIISRIPCWSRGQIGEFIRQLTWNEVFNQIICGHYGDIDREITIDENLLPVRFDCGRAFDAESIAIFSRNLLLIDSEMFNFLIRLDLLEMETYLRNLKLLSEERIRATVERTKKLIQHAEELKKLGRVITPDAWEKHSWKLAGFTCLSDISSTIDVPTTSALTYRMGRMHFAGMDSAKEVVLNTPEKLDGSSESAQNFFHFVQSFIAHESLHSHRGFKEKNIDLDRKSIAFAKKLFEEIDIPIPQEVIDRETALEKFALALEKFAKEHGK